MTLYQKRETVEKKMYKEITKGNYDKADKLLKQLVDLDVQVMKQKIA